MILLTSKSGMEGTACVFIETDDIKKYFHFRFHSPLIGYR